MSAQENERRWREALEALGGPDVRRRLQQSASGDSGSVSLSGIVREVPDPPWQFVDSWYRESRRRLKEARNARLYAVSVLVFGAVTAGIVLLSVP
jgi:hypothetical protein